MKKNIYLLKNNAEAYIDTVITIFVTIFVLYVGMSLFSYFISYQKLNYVSNQLLSFCSSRGETSTELVKQKYADLLETQGFDVDDENLKLSFSGTDYIEGSDKIQLDNKIQLTIQDKFKLKTLGKDGIYLFVMSVKNSINSNKYWKLDEISSTDNYICEIVNSTDDWEYTLLDDGTVKLNKYIGSNVQDIVVPNRYTDSALSQTFIVSSVGSIQAESKSVIPGHSFPLLTTNYHNLPASELRINICGSVNNVVTKTLKISDEVNIDSCAFTNFYSLSSVSFGNGIVYIDGNAFLGCSLLSGVNLPNSLEYIGTQAFSGCTNLKNLTMNKNLKYIDTNAFSYCSALENVVFGNNLDTIEYGAFYGTGIKNLDFNPNLKNIGDFAFYNCNKLSGDLCIPNSVNYIGAFAFYHCNCEGNLELSSTLQHIGAYAFNGAKFTGELILPDSINYIGDNAFEDANKFSNTTLRLPNNLRILGGDVDLVSRNYNLSESENLGLGSRIFMRFAPKTLQSFVISDDNQFFKTVDGVLYSKDSTRLIAYPSAKDSESYTLLEGCTKIDEYAFSNLKGNETNNLKTICLSNSFIVNNRTPNPKNFVDTYNGGFSNLWMGIYSDSQINAITVKPNNPLYSSYQGCLYSKNYATLYFAPLNNLTLNIHNECVIIDNCALQVNLNFVGNFTQINISSSVRVIEGWALTVINGWPDETRQYGYSAAAKTVANDNSKYKVVNNIIVNK